MKLHDVCSFNLYSAEIFFCINHGDQRFFFNNNDSDRTFTNVIFFIYNLKIVHRATVASYSVIYLKLLFFM